MPRLYVIQQSVPLSDMSDGETPPHRGAWPMRYVVTKLIGATEPRIGAKVTEPELKALIERADWEVTIT